MGEYTLTPEQAAAVKIISLFKEFWPENEGADLVNRLEKILYDLTERQAEDSNSAEKDRVNG